MPMASGAGPSDGQLAQLRATRSQALGETLAAFGYRDTGITGGETKAELTRRVDGRFARFRAGTDGWPV